MLRIYLFFILEKLLKSLERAWCIETGKFYQDTRWNILCRSSAIDTVVAYAFSYVLIMAVCSNWHKEFDRGGWSMLPDV
jgi:hypothetical protein